MDVDVALGHVTARLETEFGDVFSADTIDRFVAQAFQEMADHASVDRWVPVLAERFVRQQLTALRKIEGHDGSLPVVMFIDEHDAGRTQLARSLFERHAGGRVHSWSGGVVPATEIDDRVAAALGDYEIDLTHEYPKPITDELILSADVVVQLGSVPGLTLPTGSHVVVWDIPAMATLDDHELSEVADRVDQLTLGLATRLTDPERRQR